MDKNKNIRGSGGKGGGGASFYEADNTLQSTATVKTLEVISQGPIVGLVGGAQGLYINNVPVENPDGTNNFGRKVAFDTRLGYPDQSYMPGFPSVAVPISVGTEVTHATPVTYTVSSALATSARVTIGLNNGLIEQDTANNKVIGTTVEITIYRKLGAGTWEQVQNFQISGKTNSMYEEDHEIPRPLGSGVWSIKVERVTADNATATLRNTTYLSRVTELQDVQLTYDNVALVGVGVDARTVGTSSIPTRSFLVDGLLVKVPSNYNTTTRAYTGTWDGTFKFDWTNNGAWVLYDLLAHTRYGLGIDETLIDKWSFYNAAVYNDELINDGDGGTHPRYTFNYPIAARQDAAKWLDSVASAFGSKIVWLSGQATIIQDRPTDAEFLITNSSVIDGKFQYPSSALKERFTAANVTWNDPDNHYQQSIVTVDAYNETGTWATALATLTDRYGYNETNVVALGATNVAQAIRAGRWALYTALHQTEIVSFKQLVAGFDLLPGTVFKLFDEDYAGAAHEGRLLSGSTTTSINLDKEVTLTAGSSISLIQADGTLVSKNIVETSGSHSTITLTSALTSAPPEYANFIVTTATLAPREFKVLKVSVGEADVISVDAVLYDSNKFDFIEDGTYVPAPVFIAPETPQVGAPTSLDFLPMAVNEDGTIRRSLHVSWVRPSVGIVTGYNIKWQTNTGGWNTVTTAAPSFDIPVSVDGLYEVEIRAVGYNNILGLALTGSYNYELSGGGSSPLNAPTTLVEFASGTSTFTGQDLTVKWTNPSSNASVLTATLKDFEVKVLDGTTLLRTEYLPAVAAGATQQGTYTYALNLADGGPRRVLNVEVRCRDTNNNTSSAASATFTNAAPTAPTGITTFAIPEGVYISFTPVDVSDLAGYVIWGSTSTGFTPSLSNRMLLGKVSGTTIPDLAASTTYYFRIAAYDSFTDATSLETGAGLTLSAEDSVTTLSSSASTNTASFVAYKRSASAPSDNPGDVTFTFGTGITTPATDALANGWTKSFPAVDGNPCYITGAVASGTSATDTILAAEWASPVMMVNDGVDGLSSAIVYIYARNNSTSSAPSLSTTGSFTYTFATGGTTGTIPSGWSTTIPSSGGTVLWRAHCVAGAYGATDSINNTEWSTPQLFAQDGAPGADAVTYFATSTPNAITRTKTNTFVPNSIVFQNWSSSGDTAPASESLAFRFYKGTGTSSYSWGTAISGTGIQYSGQSDLGVSLSSSHTAMKYEIYVDSSYTELLDTIIVPILIEGSDGISPVLGNSAHSFTADAAGTISSYAGSGTTVRVFAGATELTYASGGANSTWTMTTTASGITAGSITDSGTYATVGNHSAMSSDTASITYNITGVLPNGGAFTLAPMQTFSKSKAGATGSTGTTGASSRVAYALYAGGTTSPVGGGDVSRSGDGLTTGLPLTTSWTTTAASSFTVTTQTPASGQQLMMSTGLYDPATGNVTWKAPILAYFRVAALSAITADLGTVTAGNYNGSGYIHSAGGNGITININGTYGSRTTAIAGNTSRTQEIGVIGLNSTANQPAIAAENSNTTSGYGLYAAGFNAVTGVASPSTGASGGAFFLDSTFPSHKYGTALLASTNTTSNTSSIGLKVETQSASQRAIVTQGGATWLNGDNSTIELRMKPATEGGTSNYGVIHSVSATNYTIGVTSSGAASSAAYAYPIDLDLATSEVRFQSNGSGGQIRLKTAPGSSGYGVILRYDGSDFYILKTASGSANGTWSSDRPFSIAMSTGAVTISNPAMRDMTTSSTFTGGAITYPTNNAAGSAAAAAILVKQMINGVWYWTLAIPA